MIFSFHQIPICLITVLGLATTAPVCAQPDYQQLQQYDGIYEYEAESPLTIAASPRDIRLFAIIQGSNYPLRWQSPDVFLNAQDAVVEFVRDPQDRILGYRVPSQSARIFKRLSTETEIGPSHWYAKPAQSIGSYLYKYAVPEHQNDGLQVAGLEHSALMPESLQLLIKDVVDNTYPTVHSILILQNGKLMVEEYFYAYQSDVLHQLRSATKSVVALLVGIALDQGLLQNLDTPISKFFDQSRSWQDTDKRKSRITVRHLLTMQSGFACDDWDTTSPGNESLMGASDDWVQFVLDLPMASEPGSRARYCSGNVILLKRILEIVSGKPLHEFARASLFQPLQITNFRWRFQPDKSSQDTFTQLYLTPRDFAKLGLLVSQKGRWQGKSIVSQIWVEDMTGQHSKLGDSDYGYLWWHRWLNVQGKRVDSIMASGNGGQKIHLFPQYDLIVVFTGGNYNRDTPTNRMLIDHILPAFVGKPQD